MQYLSLTNVVCTCELRAGEIDLGKVATALGGRLGFGVFPALVIRCNETSAVISVFSTGRVVIVGCKDESAGLLSAHMLAHALQRVCGMDRSVHNFSVCNMVYRISLPWKLNLDLIYADACADKIEHIVHDDGSGKGGPSYQPEAFPGVSLPIMCGGHPVTFALFDSGGGVGTGFIYPHQQHDANHMLYDFSKYELGNEYRQLTTTPKRRAAH